MSGYELCVGGGSLYSFFVARQAAKVGMKVVMMVPGYSLGSDITHTLRPFATGGGLGSYASLFGAEQQSSILQLGRMKKHLLFHLLDLGVDVRFGCRVIQASKDTESLRIACAGKEGVFQQEARTLFWHSEGFVGQGPFSRTLEYSNLEVQTDALEVSIKGAPKRLTLIDGLNPFHKYLVCETNADRVTDYNTYMRANEISSIDVLQTATALAQQIPAFREAILCRQSERVFFEDNRDDVLYGPCVLSYRSLPRALSLESLDNMEREAFRTLAALRDRAGQSMPDAVALPMQQGVCADVLVAGGGTLGVPAAVAAGERGARVVLAEAGNILGGIGTAGGINEYFFGNVSGFVHRIDREYHTLMELLAPSAPDFKGWNMQIRAYALNQLLCGAGVQGMLNARAVAVDMDAHRIARVCLDTPYGLLPVDARVYIDGTGDGTIAAMSGVPFDLGGGENGNIQTSNQCSWVIGQKFSGINVDMTAHIPAATQELTRTAVTAHHKGSDYDFTDFAAERESRHLRGAYTYKLSDLFLGVVADDAIIKSATPFDQHSLQTSLLSRLGFLPYHREQYNAFLPYRCCYAPEVENLLFGGKNVSAERDAFSFLRMMPDIINQGYALGCAAYDVLTRGGMVSHADIRYLQAELIRAGVLEERDLLRQPKGVEDISVAFRDKDYRALLYSICLGVSAIPILESAFRIYTDERRVWAAMGLAYYGKDCGFPLMMETLAKIYRSEQTVVTDRFKRPVGGFQGALPDDYWLANGLIVLLARLHKREFIPMLARIIDDTRAGDILRHERLHWRRVVCFDRIICLCTAAAEMPTPDIADALARLLCREALGGWHRWEHTQDDYTDYPSALLELTVARAAYRCHTGVCADVLRRYAKDVRPILARAAQNVIETQPEES